MQALVSGVFQGTIYALVGAGLALILGNLKVINLAHGSFFAFGAYLALTFASLGGLSPLISWAVIGPAAFVLAVLVYVTVVGPLREHQTAVAMATLSLGLLMESLFDIVWGPLYDYLPAALPVVRMGGLRVNLQEGFIGVLSLLILGGVFGFLRTRSGRALRFAAQDAEVAATVGIDVGRLHVLAFGLAGALAATAGGLMAPLTPIHGTMGRMPLVIGLAVVVLGGMGNVYGSLAAGVTVGVFGSLVGFYLSPAWVYILSLALIVVILAVRPVGLYGTYIRPD